MMTLNLIKIIQLNLKRNIEVQDGIDIKKTKCLNGKNKEVKKVITQKTKMIIINSPHNPTGAILRKEDLIELEKITTNSNILVLSDEVYEHLIYDDEKHYSVCSFPELSNRSIAVFSFGKTFHVTGWKLGYILAPKEIMKEIRKVHQFACLENLGIFTLTLL